MQPIIQCMLEDKKFVNSSKAQHKNCETVIHFCQKLTENRIENHSQSEEKKSE